MSILNATDPFYESLQNHSDLTQIEESKSPLLSFAPPTKYQQAKPPASVVPQDEAERLKQEMLKLAASASSGGVGKQQQQA